MGLLAQKVLGDHAPESSKVAFPSIPNFLSGYIPITVIIICLSFPDWLNLGSLFVSIALLFVLEGLDRILHDVKMSTSANSTDSLASSSAKDSESKNPSAAENEPGSIAVSSPTPEISGAKPTFNEAGAETPEATQLGGARGRGPGGRSDDEIPKSRFPLGEEIGVANEEERETGNYREYSGTCTFRFTSGGIEEYEEIITVTLEDTLRHPVLFWWCENIAGHRTIAALMRIGLFYGTAWVLKKLHTTLAKTPVVRIFYLSWLNLTNRIITSLMTSIKGASEIFSNFLYIYSPGVVYMYLRDCWRFMKFAYHRTDETMAHYIIKLIYHYPRLEETPCELLDDLLHYILKVICKIIHPYFGHPCYVRIHEAVIARSNRVRESYIRRIS